MTLAHYLWKRPQARNKCINYRNFLFCFIWMKVYLVVCFSYLNFAKMHGKDPTNSSSFPSFILREALHEGRRSCLICVGLLFMLAIKQPSVQNARYYREGWCHHQGFVLNQGNSSRSNWITYKIMILLVMQVFHFYTGCLENSRRNWKGNAGAMNKNEIPPLNHTAVSVFSEVSAYTKICCWKAQFSGKFV